MKGLFLLNTRKDYKTLQNIGRAAGKKVVLEAVLEGQVLTSLTQQTYPDYWGSVWDEKRDL